MTFACFIYVQRGQLKKNPQREKWPLIMLQMFGRSLEVQMLPLSKVSEG